MRYRTLDLRALQSFVTVVDTGSFTAAADRQNYSQSAISMQLRRLEDDLGVALLVRDTRVVEPTQPGREVLGYAREMLRLNGEVRNKLAEREVAGTVRLGLPIDYAPYIPGTLTMFAERYPFVEIEVHSDHSIRLIEQARAGEIDMAIVTRAPGETGGTQLRREPLVWVAAPGTATYKQEPLPLAISSADNCVFRAAAAAQLDAAGRQWRVAYDSHALAAQRVPVGVGLAVTATIPSLVGPDLEILDPATAQLPELPAMDVRLHRSPGRASQTAAYLADLLIERIRDNRQID